jgi:DNA-binding CsgD family transcriptional regulator
VPFNADAFYDAARQLHRGSAKNAAATQKTLAAELASRGYRFAADYATMLSLSADFDADLADRFRSRGRQLGGDRYVAYLDGQLALQRGDADEILATGRRLQALGARDEALLLLTHARRLLRGSERAPEAEAIRAEISALLEVGAPAEPSLGHSRIELTSREHELVNLVAAGLSNAEIAAQLHISVRTVDTHLRNIRKKAGATTREDLGLLASAP